MVKDYCRVEQTHVGNIVDALDYLENWHLAIVVEEKSAPKNERKLHFLPYNHKRDEVFTEEDSNKIAPAFTNTEIPAEPEKDLNTLREYLASYKLKKQQFSQNEEKKQQPA